MMTLITTIKYCPPFLSHLACHFMVKIQRKINMNPVHSSFPAPSFAGYNILITDRTVQTYLGLYTHNHVYSWVLKYFRKIAETNYCH